MKGVAEEQRVMPHKGRFDRSTDPHVAMAVMSKIQFEDNEQRRRSDEGLSSASLSSLVLGRCREVLLIAEHLNDFPSECGMECRDVLRCIRELRSCPISPDELEMSGVAAIAYRLQRHPVRVIAEASSMLVFDLTSAIRCRLALVFNDIKPLSPRAIDEASLKDTSLRACQPQRAAVKRVQQPLRETNRAPATFNDVGIRQTRQRDKIIELDSVPNAARSSPTMEERKRRSGRTGMHLQRVTHICRRLPSSAEVKFVARRV